MVAENRQPRYSRRGPPPLPILCTPAEWLGRDMLSGQASAELGRGTALIYGEQTLGADSLARLARFIERRARRGQSSYFPHGVS